MGKKQSFTLRIRNHFYPDSIQDPLDKAFSSHARAGMRVLDAGCGGARGCARESPWQEMHIVGVDTDPAVMNNPFCNEKVVCDISTLPFVDNSFDLIHCRWVLEHLKEPLKVFHEFARVLKPGGRLLVMTPNLYHYATITARLTPHRFHIWWNHEEGEPFKTYYLANSRRTLRRLCMETGFTIERMQLFECPPYYLERYWPLFLLGVMYERIVNSTSILGWIRQRIVLEARIDRSKQVQVTERNA